VRKRSRTGGYRHSYLGSQVRHDPAWAVREILEAVDWAQGRLVVAACALGVERRHLQRFCWLLGLWPAVDQIRERWATKQADTPVLRLLRRSQPGLTLLTCGDLAVSGALWKGDARKVS